VASIHKNESQNATHTVRQYDDTLSVELGKMNEEKLHAHLGV
jgi:hypothetical protein